MQRRRFGKHDFDVSALGFGMMRLPVIDNDPAKIDEDKTTEMVHYAVDHGVDYIDNAYDYHRQQSEIVLGRILKDGLRDRVKIATKCPVRLVESNAGFDRFLDTQLGKLQTDCIDMYLLHGLSKGQWPKMVEYNVFEFFDRAKGDGRIRFAGYSFHDDLATFKTIVDSYPWDFCQIQFNYMDEHFQAGVEGLQYASRKGMAVVIMEPLRGGKLVKNVPAEVQAVWDRAPIKRTPAEWGLRWVWNHPEVTVVLSGMGALDQVRENVRTAETAFPNSLSEKEIALYEEVRESYRRRIKINCTKCQYCQPCPQGIAIPDWLDTYNSAYMYGSRDELARNYDRFKEGAGDPAKCADCGNCEAACPQQLPVRQLLKDLNADLSRKP
jgi:predicted aldo/keto reductase-like oxidoreductase